jgi:serine/threonine-protein kinase
VSTGTRIGTTVAGYRLEALLGRGGMSVVYLAEHQRLGRKVALKLLASPLSQDESFRERFEHESRRAAEIDHPNILPIYDAGEADGQLYIAMRYVKGADLKTMIARDGALSPGRGLFILEQAASALDAAHDRGLVHRDVKPANILVEEPSEHVYLTDFGIVKHTASPGLTRTGLFIGTADYAAPEQIEGMPVDARTDVYALGCVMYECLTGRAPYERDSEVAVMHAHLTEPPPVLTDASPELPKTLNRVIARAMAKVKEERYASCEELVAATRSALIQATATPSTAAPSRAAAESPPTVEVAAAPESEKAAPVAPAVPPPPPPEAPKPGARGRPAVWLAALGVAAVAALAAGLAVYFLGRSDEPEAAPATPATVTVVETQTEPAPAAEPSPPAETVAAAEAELAAVVPARIWSTCTAGDPLVAGAAASALCRPAPGSSGGTPPDSVELSTFPNEGSRAAAYAGLLAEAGVEPGSGRCTGTSWGGEGVWNHGLDKPGGHRFCYFDGDDAVIVWTHEKLGQENHVDTLGVARLGGLDHRSLYRWWSFWVHELGKHTET